MENCKLKMENCKMKAENGKQKKGAAARAWTGA